VFTTVLNNIAYADRPLASCVGHTVNTGRLDMPPQPSPGLWSEAALPEWQLKLMLLLVEFVISPLLMPITASHCVITQPQPPFFLSMTILALVVLGDPTTTRLESRLKKCRTPHVNPIFLFQAVSIVKGCAESRIDGVGIEPLIYMW